ncbi:MAG: type III toxin-antitoxin system ToxN/AbiQ family toxin, partial [Treponema sp.]|nr:type III toxin-antitoxin system ToxN/AbiQ family toxin [Treponema sp.]
ISENPNRWGGTGIPDAPCFLGKGEVVLYFYEINPAYVDYLLPFAPHIFHNKTISQDNSRKYIGIVLSVNGLDYFVPLSSFKEKHRKMPETVDFLKLKALAVLNLNNMFPVPKSERTFVNINKMKNVSYMHLLREEYRVIKILETKIIRNAQIVYSHKVHNGNKTPLCKRCNDFTLLEEKARVYASQMPKV